MDGGVDWKQAASRRRRTGALPAPHRQHGRGALADLQNMCLDAHLHESTGRGGVGGQLAESTAGAGESTASAARGAREENFRLGCAPAEPVCRRS